MNIPGEVLRDDAEYESALSREAKRIRANEIKRNDDRLASMKKNKGVRKSEGRRSPSAPKQSFNGKVKQKRSRKSAMVVKATPRERILNKARKNRAKVDALDRRKTGGKFQKAITKQYQTFKNVVSLDFESPSRVLPFILLGDRHDAANKDALLRVGVSHILNAAFQIPNYHERHFIYCNLPVFDRVGEDISQYFEKASQFIHEARMEKTCVLVHCIAGVSRSTSCVLAYLMTHENMRLLDAWKFVRRARPIVCPNESFRLQLAFYEVQVFGASSICNTPIPEWNFYMLNKEKGKFKRAEHHGDHCCVVS